MTQRLKYLHGFGNELRSEAEKGVVPVGQNSPQVPPRGLYAEQLSGTAFTAPRAENRRTWCYKILPSVVHAPFESIAFNSFLVSDAAAPGVEAHPNQMRWGPYEGSSKTEDLWESLRTLTVCGSAEAQEGGALHLYATRSENGDRFFYNSDAEMIFLPWDGRLRLKTELGTLELGVGEIALLPRGLKVQVELPDGAAKGYLMENFGRAFRLPELGPIGANGLANPRDFLIPEAAYELRRGKFEVINKFGGRFFRALVGHSPLDVVGWSGNYLPCKYDLFLFNTMGSISFDHPDPSIFTVLTSPSERPGTANMDFVIFPPRWLVGEHTFRPPYYHRNCMSEYMGLLTGNYDAKEKGFVAGGSSLHNAMSGHGPDAMAFEKASRADLKPEKLDKTMAFMFETRWLWKTTEWAMKSKSRHRDYAACWSDLKASFKSR